MAISNIVLAYPNRISECSISSTDTWQALLPLTNVFNPVLKRVARTGIGTRSAIIKLNLTDQVRLIGVVALVNHNLTTNAHVTFEGFSGLDFKSASTGEVLSVGDRFNSTYGFKAYPMINPNDSGVNLFEDPAFWGGTMPENERAAYTPLTTYFADKNVAVQSVKITISDEPTISATSSTSMEIGVGAKTFTISAGAKFFSGQKITIYEAGHIENFMSGIVSSCVGTSLLINVSSINGAGTKTAWNIINGDNFIQIGRIFLGKCIEPRYNPEYGDLSQGYVDLTETQRASDNTKYFYIKPKMRTVSCVLKHLDQDEAFGGFYDAQREVGLSGELLYAYSKPEYVKDGGTTVNMTRDKNFYARTFLCNFSELNPIEMPYFNGFSTALKLEEIV